MPTIAQQKLVDRIKEVLSDDKDIEAAWLAGSLGRGGGDRFSDIDVLILCTDGKASEVSSRYAASASSIAPAVLVNPLFGGRVLNVVTEGWQRFDLTFIEGQQLPMSGAAYLKALFNRGSRAAQNVQSSPYETRPEQLLKLVNEFLRVLGLLPVVMGREEYALALSGIEHLRKMTFDLMLEENGVGPQDRGGALRLNPLLKEDQKKQLAALPPLVATRESVMSGHLAFARIFLPRARKLADAIGMTWPEAFESATRKHLHKELQLEI